jgi:hypothetical protein
MWPTSSQITTYFSKYIFIYLNIYLGI